MPPAGRPGGVVDAVLAAGQDRLGRHPSQPRFLRGAAHPPQLAADLDRARTPRDLAGPGDGSGQREVELAGPEPVAPAAQAPHDARRHRVVAEQPDEHGGAHAGDDRVGGQPLAARHHPAHPVARLDALDGRAAADAAAVRLEQRQERVGQPLHAAAHDRPPDDVAQDVQAERERRAGRVVGRQVVDHAVGPRLRRHAAAGPRRLLEDRDVKALAGEVDRADQGVWPAPTITTRRGGAPGAG